MRFGLSRNLSLRSRAPFWASWPSQLSTLPPSTKAASRGCQTALRNFALSNGECLEGGCERKTVSPCQWTSSTGTQTVSDVGWAVAGFQSSPGAGGAGLALHAPTFLSLITVSGHAPQCSGNSIPILGWDRAHTQNNPRCGLPVTADEGRTRQQWSTSPVGVGGAGRGSSAASSEAASLRGPG